MSKSKIQNPKSKVPRGSVLAFCVVVLCVLAMIGMTFLLTVQQASRASQNSLDPLQADLAVRAGLNHAAMSLRQMVAQQSIVFRDAYSTAFDGVFSPNPATNYRYSFATYLAWEQANYPPGGGPPAPDAYFLFVGGTGPTDSALLCVDPLDTAHKSEWRYTNTPMRVSDPANMQFFAGDPRTSPVMDRAFRWEVQGSTNPFYPKMLDPLYHKYLIDPYDSGTHITLLKELPRLGSVRGCYHVWIEDLDAKLHVLPALWGMDDLVRYIMNLPTYQPNQTLPQGPDTLNLPSTVYVSPQATQNGIVNYLNALLKNQPANVYLQTKDVSYIVTQQPKLQEAYETMGELGLNLPSLITFANVYPPTNDSVMGYEDMRSTVGYYFKTGCLNDTQRTPFPAALNINTAPVEVIEAALSQIPAWDADGNSLSPPNPNPAITFAQKMDIPVGTPHSLANRLAMRIVMKRPFLCRMDFEDFAAAHLQGVIDPNDADPNALSTPLGAIHKAIRFRKDPNRADGRIELSLQQYLEIPGNSQDPAPYAAYAALLNPDNMRLRFEFFASDSGLDPSSPYLRSNTVLAVKEFNNLLNSVSHNAFNTILPNQATQGSKPPALLSAGDDRQITAPGEKGVAVIHPGLDGALSAGVQAALGGDDILGQIIVPGPARVLQTTPVAPDQLVTEAISPCISAGVNGILETTLVGADTIDPTNPLIIIPGADGILHSVPAGDDVLLTSVSYIVPATGASTLATAPAAGTGDKAVPAVLSGLNGVAETSIFGFSYYSHDTADQYYMPARLPALYPEPNPSLPQYVGKFVYRNQTKEQQSQVPQQGQPPRSAPDAIMNYVITDLQRWSCVGNGERSGYYDMFFNLTDIMRMYLTEKDDPQPPPTPPPPPNPKRVCVESDDATRILHTGWGSGDDVYDATVKTTDGVNSKEAILIGQDVTNSTSVWGPVRASQRFGPLDTSGKGVSDQLAATDPALLAPRPQYSQMPTYTPVMVLLNADQIPSAVTPAQPPISWTTIAAAAGQPTPAGTPVPSAVPAPYGNSDVSWSPQFTFRSRFFGIYVLGRGYSRVWNPPIGQNPQAEIPANQASLRTNLKSVGERRLEAVYDALKDEIIWQRAPVTEKRSLADP